MNKLLFILLMLVASCSKSQETFTYQLNYYSVNAQSGAASLQLCVDRSDDNHTYTEKCTYGTPYFNNYITIGNVNNKYVFQYTWVTETPKYTIKSDCGDCQQFSADLYINNVFIGTKTATFGVTGTSINFTTY